MYTSTNTAAIIRIVNHSGKRLSKNLIKDIFNNNDNINIPKGNNGLLNLKIIDNPDNFKSAEYTIIIYGDLYNHNNIDQIYDYLYNVCKQIELNNITIKNAIGYIISTNNVNRTFQYVTK